MKAVARTCPLPKGAYSSAHKWLGSPGAKRAALVTLALAASAVAGAALAPTTVQAATEVNTCGQSFSGKGFLAADLDCTSFGGDAVTIQGGTLDLQGFTLTAGTDRAILSDKSCTIESSVAGGLVTGGRIVCRNVRIIGVTVSNAPNQGVLTINGSVKLIDAVISNSGGRGVDATKRVRMLRSTVTGSVATGVEAPKVKMIDSEVSANGAGISSGDKVTLKNSVVSNNVDAGISCNAFVIKNSTVTGNGGPGIFSGWGRAKLMGSDVSANGEQGIFRLSGKMSIRDSTITNNALEGIFLGPYPLKIDGSTIRGNGLDGVVTHGSTIQKRIRSSTSTLTGNGTDLAVCGVIQTCADVTTAFAPKLSATSCDTSYVLASGFPGTSWGLCALD